MTILHLKVKYSKINLKIFRCQYVPSHDFVTNFLVLWSLLEIQSDPRPISFYLTICQYVSLCLDIKFWCQWVIRYIVYCSVIGNKISLYVLYYFTLKNLFRSIGPIEIYFKQNFSDWNVKIFIEAYHYNIIFDL